MPRSTLRTLQANFILAIAFKMNNQFRKGLSANRNEARIPLMSNASTVHLANAALRIVLLVGLTACTKLFAYTGIGDKNSAATPAQISNVPLN